MLNQILSFIALSPMLAWFIMIIFYDNPYTKDKYIKI